MLDTRQIENLQRRKRYSLGAFIAIGIAFIVACLLRFIPGLNDRLAGKPRYVRALTTLMAQEFGKAVQERFPVLLFGQDEDCAAASPVQITDDQIVGILYAFTYSERQHFSCISTYAVPVDSSKFSSLHTLQPESEWAAGPTITRNIKVILVARDLHVYSAAYMQSMHWRNKPRFPLSEDQAKGLAARQYQSRSSVALPDSHANINIDFEKARALVREPHDKANIWLMLFVAALFFCEFCLTLSFIGPYRKLSAYLGAYGYRLSFSDFLLQDMNQKAPTAQRKYHEQERERQEQERKAATELAVRHYLEDKLRSASANLQDDGLRQKIQQCLGQSPDIDVMEHLWAEVQKTAGHRSPGEKLVLLLESLKPYCTEEELGACRSEATEILAQSSFRAARNYVISMHDRFKLRMRQMEEMKEGNGLDDT